MLLNASPLDRDEAAPDQRGEGGGEDGAGLEEEGDGRPRPHHQPARQPGAARQVRGQGGAGEVRRGAAQQRAEDADQEEEAAGEQEQRGQEEEEAAPRVTHTPEVEEEPAALSLTICPQPPPILAATQGPALENRFINLDTKRLLRW